MQAHHRIEFVLLIMVRRILLYRSNEISFLRNTISIITIILVTNTRLANYALVQKYISNMKYTDIITSPFSTLFIRVQPETEKILISVQL